MAMFLAWKFPLLHARQNLTTENPLFMLFCFWACLFLLAVFPPAIGRGLVTAQPVLVRRQLILVGISVYTRRILTACAVSSPHTSVYLVKYWNLQPVTPTYVWPYPAITDMYTCTYITDSLSEREIPIGLRRYHPASVQCWANIVEVGLP